MHVYAKALVVTLAALAFGSCGEEDADTLSPKARYTQEMREAIRKIEQRAPKNPSPDEIGPIVRRAASDLEEIDPPQEIRRAHRGFVTGMRQLARDLEPVIDAYLRKDLATVRRMLTTNSWVSARALRLVRAARREFAARGYRLGDVSRLPTP